MKISPAQRAFMVELMPDPVNLNNYFLCGRKEARTAMALHRKGLVEFNDGLEPHPGCEWFEARLTQKALDTITVITICF